MRRKVTIRGQPRKTSRLILLQTFSQQNSDLEGEKKNQTQNTSRVVETGIT